MGLYGSPDLRPEINEPVWQKNMIFCWKCGTRYSKKLGRCPNCKTKHTKQFYNMWWFWILVFVFGFLFMISFMPDLEMQETDETSANQVVISKEEYISQCEQVPYSEMARNPNSYIDKYVYFTGQVVQVQEDGGYLELRINVTNNSYFWSDTVYVEYARKSNDEPRIFENDIVTFYGKANGIKSYTAVLGNKISIPYVLSEYIDIDNK